MRPKLRAPDAPVIFPTPDNDVNYTAGQPASAIQGRTVRIASSATGNPTPNIRWRLPGGKRIGLGQSYGRARVMGDYTLVLENVQPQDAGTYRAIASNTAGLDKAKSRLRVIGKQAKRLKGSLFEQRLLFLVPPRLSETIQGGIRMNNQPVVASQRGSILVPAGSAVSLRCAASGVPNPSVRFIRDGLLVTRGVRTTRRFATLTLNNVQNDDTGTYSCVAENIGGAATSSVDVVVARKLVVVTIDGCCSQPLHVQVLGCHAL